MMSLCGFVVVKKVKAGCFFIELACIKSFIKLNAGIKTVDFIINKDINLFNILGDLGICNVLKHGKIGFPC